MKNWWILLLWIPFCSSVAQTTPKIGDCYGGGVVFYVNPEGNGGLIAALNDSGTTMSQSDAVTMASNYTSADNCSTCSNWRLATKQELQLLFFQLTLNVLKGSLFMNCKGTNPDYIYWSATPYNSNWWFVEFETLSRRNLNAGRVSDYRGSVLMKARAVRTF